MKNFIILLGFVLLFSLSAIAQGASQQKGKPEKAKEQPTKGNDKIKVENENKPEPKEEKENNGKGNAYGKNKGDLSGREFGQQRAGEARSKSEKVENAQLRNNETKESLNSAKEKLETANKTLEEKLKRKEISKEEYDLKKQKINSVARELNELEQRQIKSTQKIEQLKN